MINIFFDCEFTKFQEAFDPEPNELISIGCISDHGQKFYAENTNFHIEACSEFVHAVVLPLLEGGDNSMPYSMVAKQIREYIESFDDGSGQANIKMWTDAPLFDWPHVQHMFDNWGWPANLVRKPIALSFQGSIQTKRFKAGVEDAFKSLQPPLRRHHALDDAIANRYGFQRANDRRY